MKDPTRITAGDLTGQSTLLEGLPFVGEFLSNASARDFIYAVVIPVFGTMLLFEQLPDQFSQYGVYAIFIVALLGTGLVAVIPEYTSLSGLLNQYKIFKTRASESRMVESSEDEKVNHRKWETSESTIEKTHVKKVYGDEGVIERDDGVIVAAMKVEGMNLDKATQRTQNEATQSFRNFLNSSLDFPIQIYLTTRKFDSTEFLQKYEDRLEDSEIQENPIMEMYLNHYIERTPIFLSQQYYREYYILVPVSTWDVRRESREGGSLNFESIPSFGDFLAELFGSSDVGKLTDDQIKQRQIDEAKKRMRKIKQAGIAPLDGARGNILEDANEYSALIKEFWEGRDMSNRDNSELIRNQPISMGRLDQDEVEEKASQVDTTNFLEDSDTEDGDTQ
jgi:hypothetical protein